jgi:hypothetical protein
MVLRVAVGLYLRSLEPGHARDFTLACVASTTLFFYKYNYGLIWILPMTARQLLVRLNSRARSMLTFTVFPIALWMVVPSHTINFVPFLVNRSAGPPLS